MPHLLEELLKTPIIQLVDDDAEFTTVLSDRLTAESIHIMIVHSGLEALSCLQISRPSVILLDFNTPGMDGIETLQAIQLVDPKIPVIMVTVRSPGVSAASSGVRCSGVRSEAARLDITSTDVDLCVRTVVYRRSPSRGIMPPPPLLRTDEPCVDARDRVIYFPPWSRQHGPSASPP